MADEPLAPAVAPDAASAFTGDGERPTPAVPPVARGGDAPARAESPASDSFAEAAPDAEAEGAARPDGPAGAARDGKGRFAAHSAAFVARQQQIQTEIEELVRVRETARAEAAAARAEADRLRASGRAPGNGHAAPAAPEAEPALEAFLAQGKPYEDWIKAWNRWDRTQALEARFAQLQQQQTATQQQAAEQRALEAFGQRVEAFTKDHPDYPAVVTQPDLPAPSQAIIEYIQHEDDGPALAYHLAHHPDEITRLTRLGNSKPAFTAMGRLAAGLGAPTLTTSPGVVSGPITNAHPPVTPVTGAGSTATRAEDLPFNAEYIRRMNAQDQKRRSGR